MNDDADAVWKVANAVAGEWLRGRPYRHGAFDEAVQTAAEAGWRALSRYDPSHGVTLATWLWGRCRGALKDVERRERRRHLHIVPFDRDPDGDWVDEPAAPDTVDQACDAAEVAAVACADGRDVTILAGLVAGYTLGEVGATVGVSEGRVCQLRSAMRDRLRADI